MSIGTVNLPVFSPTRTEQGTNIAVSGGTIWSPTTDTTYKYSNWDSPVPIKAGLIRGVPDGVTSIEFSQPVIVEIQE